MQASEIWIRFRLLNLVVPPSHQLLQELNRPVRESLRLFWIACGERFRTQRSGTRNVLEIIAIRT